MKIAVALSGGVDSAYVAALLIEKGHEVIGATMRHFDPVTMGFTSNGGIDAAIIDAQKVATKLGIPYHVIDVQKPFQDVVINDFIKQYESGKTPNPCTICNPTIKWGVFFDSLISMGVEAFATGHYVKKEIIDGKYYLRRAKDDQRDQTYMLWRLSQEQLQKTIFPLSEYRKSDVRKYSEELQLPVASKKDSQEICFIPDSYISFLDTVIGVKRGYIIHSSGKVLGYHNGLYRYTIGQRKGMGISWSSPLYVYNIDTAQNVLYVTDDIALLERDEFYIEQTNWMSGCLPSERGLIVQIRYNSKPIEVIKLEQQEKRIKVALQQRVISITSGQSAVFYNGDLLLGGGIIS